MCSCEDGVYTDIRFLVQCLALTKSSVVLVSPLLMNLEKLSTTKAHGVLGAEYSSEFHEVQSQASSQAHPLSPSFSLQPLVGSF